MVDQQDLENNLSKTDLRILEIQQQIKDNLATIRYDKVSPNMIENLQDENDNLQAEMEALLDPDEESDDYSEDR